MLNNPSLPVAERPLTAEQFSELKQKIHNLLICPITKKRFEKPVVITINGKSFTVDESAVDFMQAGSQAGGFRTKYQGKEYEVRPCFNRVIDDLINRLYIVDLERGREESIVITNDVEFKNILEETLTCRATFSFFVNPEIIETGFTYDNFALKSNRNPLPPFELIKFCYENTLVLHLKKIFLQYYPQPANELIAEDISQQPQPPFPQDLAVLGIDRFDCLGMFTGLVILGGVASIFALKGVEAAGSSASPVEQAFGAGMGILCFLGLILFVMFCMNALIYPSSRARACLTCNYSAFFARNNAAEEDQALLLENQI